MKWSLSDHRGCPPFRTPCEEWTASSSSYSEAAESYLGILARNTTEATYLSHQTALSKFISWYQNTRHDRSESIRELGVRFADHLVSKDKLSIDTVCGYFHSISNFLAYIHQANPGLLKRDIAIALKDNSSPKLDAIGSRLFGPLETNFATIASVHALLAYLQHRRYGTREHAFVELLVDTRARPLQVQHLDLAQVDFDGRTATVGIDKSHLVSRIGLLTKYTVSLSQRTTDVLSVYLEHERKSIPDTNAEPVFTTRHGRVSDSTLHRSIRRASESALRYASYQREGGECEEGGESTEAAIQTVTLRDVWQYAVSSVSDNQ